MQQNKQYEGYFFEHQSDLQTNNHFPKSNTQKLGENLKEIEEIDLLLH